MISAARPSGNVRAPTQAQDVPCMRMRPTNEIWAVVVAYQRDKEVERPLKALAQQSTKLSGIIVVDDAHQASTACLSERHSAHYIGSKRNLGGAGGFALGMMSALAHGAEHIWLWDDDGFPEDEHCLGLLLAAGGQAINQ